MKFKHNHFGIEVDTELDLVKNKFTNLDSLYKRIPQTICLFCPKKQKVEADCCKHFSPPMYLIEFLNSLKYIEKLSEDEQNKLYYSCFVSFLNPNIIRPCVLLKDDRCSIHGAHPFSCKMYPSYPKPEWRMRLEKVSKDWNIPIDEIPMKDQCSNVRIEGKIEKISIKEENKIFKEIAELDVSFFEDENFGKEIVYSASTYLPFDAHYLLMKEGPDKLEELSDIRSLLIKEKEKFSLGKINKDKLLKLESEVEDSLKDIKNRILPKLEE